MMRIDIFSDTVCPWCYLGKRRLHLAVLSRPQYEFSLTWRPFELNPEMPLEGMDRTAYLSLRGLNTPRFIESQNELQRLGAASGIDYRFDLIKRVPNSRFSHLLIAHAARFGLAAEVKERIMKGYFEEGRDIGDVEQLAQLAKDVGLSADRARHALVLRIGQDGVVASERHAHVLGITGVPTFVFDGQYTLAGAQEVGVFAQILDQVAEMASAKGAS
ncbi:MAG TPA: DsbA family oxidoreductase [Steroidobacteraceae bacterium]